jgi:hypothetical protein
MTSSWSTFSHRIDTRPEGTLLCVLAWEKRPKFFYVLWRHPGVHTALCTYVFLWKTSVCTPGWRQIMVYFHVSTRKISDKISSEWHFWSMIQYLFCGLANRFDFIWDILTWGPFDLSWGRLELGTFWLESEMG